MRVYIFQYIFFANLTAYRFARFGALFVSVTAPFWRAYWRGCNAMTYVTFLIAHRVGDPPCARSVVHKFYSSRFFDR